MSDPYLGEIRLMAFGTPPRNWAPCNGQLLAISQYQALFSVLGTSYGGNGVTNFALPDLRTRTPRGTDPNHQTGMQGGETVHTLTVQEMPAHTHSAATGGNATQASPAAAFWGGTTAAAYQAAAPDVAMSAASVTGTGSTQPHENMPPFLGLTFAISLQGVYPSRS
ncbi:tail fiber protein [Humibacter antri]